MHKFTVRRELTQNRDQTKSLEHIKRCVISKPAWKIQKVEKHTPQNKGSNWVFTYTLYLEKTSGRRNDENLIQKEWDFILDQVRRLAVASRWGDWTWELVDDNPLESPSETQSSLNDESEAIVKPEKLDDIKTVKLDDGGVHHAVGSGIITLEELKDRTWDTLNLLINDEDALREEYSGIFDREAQIRTVLSSIASFLETNGKRRNHCMLHGLPACAKTQIMMRTMELMGEDSYIRLDATSTTSAGIYKLFFKELETVPPFVFMEEMEKTSEETLRVWLGALDDRGELRKVNYHQMQVRSVQILCLGTANDKMMFDRLMASKNSSQPGALSSRFVHQVECPRPDRRVLSKILHRDIDSYGGKLEWIEPVLDLAELVDTNDPRKVLAFLDGRDRLMTGEYQRDICKIYNITPPIEKQQAA